jgi:hypothetical protein
MLGYQPSAETRAKVSASLLGELNPVYGLASPNRVKIIVYSLDGELIQEWPSFKAAVSGFNISRRTLRKYLISGRPFRGQVFSYSPHPTKDGM